MNFDKELTLLSEQEVWGVNGGRQLDVLDKYGTLLIGVSITFLNAFLTSF